LPREFVVLHVVGGSPVYVGYAACGMSRQFPVRNDTQLEQTSMTATSAANLGCAGKKSEL
jgi:hypothetical protein